MESRNTPKKRQRGVVVVLAAAIAVVASLAPASAAPAPAAYGAVTIGSSLAKPSNEGLGCAGPTCTYSQSVLPGRPLASPVNGIVTAWRLRGALATNATVRLRVLRPLGGSFLFHSSSAAESVALGDAIHTFAATVPIAAGDRIGVDRLSGGLLPFANPVAGALVQSWHPAPGDGAMAPPSFDDSDRELLLNADIEPDCDADGLGDDTQDPDTSSCSPPPPPPSNDFSFKVKKNKNKGKAKAKVKVPGPGDVALAKNKKVTGKRKSAESEGTVKLPIKPKRKAKKKLNRKGKTKVKAKVTYTPAGGEPNTKTKKVGLKKKG